MKSKLIKHEVDYYCLLNNKGEVIADVNGGNISKLSLKNCQAIELGYDLDELVKSKYPNVNNEDYEYFSEAEMLRDEYKSRGFYEGAKAIIELMGDKKFSEEDMRKAMDRVWDWCEDDKDEDCSSMTELRNKHIQSLQQTEWNVIVVMEVVYDGLDEMAQPQYYKQPKLDSDGCLILKRK